MPRISCIWLLLAGGFLCLLVNSIWTKHQINEILAREFSSEKQVCKIHCLALDMFVKVTPSVHAMHPYNVLLQS